MRASTVFSGVLSLGLLIALWFIMSLLMNKAGIDANVTGAALGLSAGILPKTYNFLSTKMRSSTSYAEASTADQEVLKNIFIGSIMLLASVKVAAFVYGTVFEAYSMPSLSSLLSGLTAENTSSYQIKIFLITIAPLTIALWTVIAPFVGGWVHTTPSQTQHTLIGWGSVILYSLFDLAITIISKETLENTFEIHLNYTELLFGGLLLILYNIFFMGIGYNISKAFKKFF